MSSYDPASWYAESLPPDLGGKPQKQSQLSGGDSPDRRRPPGWVLDPDERPARRADDASAMLIPHWEQFSTQWSAGLRKYWSRFDEALRDNWQNALAMRRDPFIHELLRLRQMPVVATPWSVTTDDPDDPEQKPCAARATKLLEAVPRFQDMKLWLLESRFYGKTASQIAWGPKWVDGRRGITIVHHEPVSGDSIIYTWSGSPCILVRANWAPPRGREGDVVPAKQIFEQADRGRVLVLRDPYWRDRFCIMKFECSGADFMFEGDLAAAMHGMGLRSRLYYGYRRRQNYMAWRENAAQRFPINGTIVGYYPSGNVEAQTAAMNAVKLMSQQYYSVFPVDMNKPERKWFERLDAPTSGYEQFDTIIKEIEDNLRRCVLGEELSSMSKPLGLGNSGAGMLQRETREAWMRYDLADLDETLTEEVLKVLIRLNEWDYRGARIPGDQLPFGMKITSQIDQTNVEERSKAIATAAQIGLELSKKATYKDLGLTAPETPDDAIASAPAMAGVPGGLAPSPSGAPGSSVPHPPGANGVGSPAAPGLPGAAKPPTTGVPRIPGLKPIQAVRGPDGKMSLRPGAGVGFTGKPPEKPGKVPIKRKQEDEDEGKAKMQPGTNGKVKLAGSR